MTTDEAIAQLKQYCPKLFRHGLRPFKINIKQDLIDAGIPEDVVKATMEVITTSRRYLEACRAGHARYDISGRRDGLVTWEQCRQADNRLLDLRLRERDQMRQRRMNHNNAPRGGPTGM